MERSSARAGKTQSSFSRDVDRQHIVESGEVATVCRYYALQDPNRTRNVRLGANAIEMAQVSVSRRGVTARGRRDPWRRCRDLDSSPVLWVEARAAKSARSLRVAARLAPLRRPVQSAGPTLRGVGSPRNTARGLVTAACCAFALYGIALVIVALRRWVMS